METKDLEYQDDFERAGSSSDDRVSGIVPKEEVSNSLSRDSSAISVPDSKSPNYFP